MQIRFPDMTCAVCGQPLPPGSEAEVHPTRKGPQGGKRYYHSEHGAQGNPSDDVIASVHKELARRKKGLSRREAYGRDPRLTPADVAEGWRIDPKHQRGQVADAFASLRESGGERGYSPRPPRPKKKFTWSEATLQTLADSMEKNPKHFPSERHPFYPTTDEPAALAAAVKAKRLIADAGFTPSDDYTFATMVPRLGGLQVYSSSFESFPNTQGHPKAQVYVSVETGEVTESEGLGHGKKNPKKSALERFRSLPSWAKHRLGATLARGSGPLEEVRILYDQIGMYDSPSKYHVLLYWVQDPVSRLTYSSFDPFNTHEEAAEWGKMIAGDREIIDHIYTEYRQGDAKKNPGERKWERQKRERQEERQRQEDYERNYMVAPPPRSLRLGQRVRWSRKGLDQFNQWSGFGDDEEDRDSKYGIPRAGVRKRDKVLKAMRGTIVKVLANSYYVVWDGYAGDKDTWQEVRTILKHKGPYSGRGKYLLPKAYGLKVDKVPSKYLVSG